MKKEYSSNKIRFAEDLTWIDMLKGMAIVGVVYDHWVPYWGSSSSSQLYSLIRKVPWGTPVHLFFLLSGLGLMISYLNRKPNWSWARWIWRRITKIVVPYWLAVLFSFLARISSIKLYQSTALQFSWKSLFACLTFTRGFVPESWIWNLAFWFVPIIIGLYFCFPLSAKILQKRGPWVMFTISALVTYGSIIASALISGRYRKHDEAFFLFFFIQFALGMIMAYERNLRPGRLTVFFGFRPFLIGISIYILSWGLRTYVPNGSSYNDLLTMVGVFLILINAAWIAKKRIPKVADYFGHLGKRSYLIFLIHYPIMAFIIGPMVGLSVHPVVMFFLGILFIWVIYLLCVFISKPLDKFTSWLYGRYPI